MLQSRYHSTFHSFITIDCTLWLLPFSQFSHVLVLSNLILYLFSDISLCYICSQIVKSVDSSKSLSLSKNIPWAYMFPFLPLFLFLSCHLLLLYFFLFVASAHFFQDHYKYFFPFRCVSALAHSYSLSLYIFLSCSFWWKLMTSTAIIYFLLILNLCSPGYRVYWGHLRTTNVVSSWLRTINCVVIFLCCFEMKCSCIHLSLNISAQK